jgi:AAA15 family ATPase/GTPase
MGNISYIEPEIGLLKTTAIYGSNASGKTNLLLALETLTKLITVSGDWKDGDRIDVYEPYLLSKSTLDKETTLHMVLRLIIRIKT